MLKRLSDLPNVKRITKKSGIPSDTRDSQTPAHSRKPSARIISPRYNESKNDHGSDSNTSEKSKGVPGFVAKVAKTEHSKVKSLPQMPQSGVPHSKIDSEKSHHVTKNSRETSDNDIIIDKENERIIIIKNGRRLEIEYRFSGYIEGKVKDMKIPLFPQYELSVPPQSVMATIRYYKKEQKKGESQGNDEYKFVIANLEEVVEKIYEKKKSIDRHITTKDITTALEMWVNELELQPMYKDVLEVVKDWDEWKKINKDPINFFLELSKNDTVDDDNGITKKLKIATLLSIVSSHLKRNKSDTGIVRVHLILTGKSSAGKSTTIKSILKYFYERRDNTDDPIVFRNTRLTQNALGYIRSIDTFDGRVLFVEQIDNLEGVKYLREALSEGVISTTVPVRDPKTEEMKDQEVIVEGEPAFISTNVVASIDTQILNRTVQPYLPSSGDKKFKEKKRRKIWFKKGLDDEQFNRIKLVTYAWLKSLPDDPEPTEESFELVNKIFGRFDNADNDSRATEITKAFSRAVASLRRHDKIEREDVEFVMKLFKKDIILMAHYMSERDLEILKWLKDHGYIKEDENKAEYIENADLSRSLKLLSKETMDIMNSMYNMGLVDKDIIGKKVYWALTPYALTLIQEIDLTELGSDEANEVIETETGMGTVGFFRGDERGRDSEDPMPRNDGEGMRGDEREDGETLSRREAEIIQFVQSRNPRLADLIRKFGDTVNGLISKGMLETFVAGDDETYVRLPKTERSPVNNINDICASFDRREITEEEYASETPIEVFRCLRNAKAYMENTEDGKRVYRYIYPTEREK
ncbi:MULTISPECIES: hypothetical protein [Metallosphaera]|uniref:Uncharacterized protein n=2 Tax=Metallosphaera sedula TaxID=43687 RepID=A4YJ19_METS5|nr:MULTISPECIES: hypothetical protein [Metallosphaera]ABP96421.1 hypothetical protein Msed_2283 [Metallosphaera sedula DSM 5348]AIM28404.1 hypothetical protein HA72_2283 [Metallosphaera sedula]MCY0862589.1 hypothetical protein [Metallosphaera prunae]WPX06233.1 hypothetical protein SOJ17_002311 [Metallosphaera sedula DSM 5348]BBL48478.1 hypothetical protein MJ1HA_2610 [Metallosphaera sedula]